MDIEKLKQVVPNVKSFTQLSRRMGLNCISHLSMVCKRENINTSHFTGVTFGTRSEYVKRADDDVFVEKSTYARRLIKERIMSQRLIPYVCSICGIEPIWQGKPMPLILDHINGVNNDNRLENLRFVCSNCDSQLDTYKSKNRK